MKERNRKPVIPDRTTQSLLEDKPQRCGVVIEFPDMREFTDEEAFTEAARLLTEATTTLTDRVTMTVGEWVAGRKARHEV